MEFNVSPADEVQFDINFAKPPEMGLTNLQQVSGGIRVLVDHQVLTKYQNEQRLEEEYDETYTYKGSHIFPLMRNLLRVAVEFQQGQIDPGRQTERRCEIYEASSYIVYSWISTEYVRLAFQTDSPSDKFVSPLWAALGVPVPHEVLYTGLVEAGRTLSEYVSASGIDRDESSAFRQFSSNLSTMESNL